MNHTLLYGYGDGCITIFDPKSKQPITVHENSLNYHALRDALNANDKELVFELLDEKQVLNNVTNGRVTVIGDTVKLDGKELHTADNWAGSDGRLMIVEYSPADIVSVPDESGYGKLRVSRYKVIDESHTRNILNDGAYGHETNQTLYIWELIDGYAHGIEPYRIPISLIQERYPDADTDLILSSIRNHSDYLASITFDDGEPSEIILNS
jgi:hypothetical protein